MNWNPHAFSRDHVPSSAHCGPQEYSICELTDLPRSGVSRLSRYKVWHFVVLEGYVLYPAPICALRRARLCDCGMEKGRYQHW
jgi:hypothetical protein